MRAGKNNSGRKPGVPDGISYKNWPYHRRKAKKRTEKIIKRMAELKIFEPDNNIAKQAIEETVKILSSPGEERTRLQAAKVLLEYTQRKPVTASEVTLNKAEALLDAIADDPNFDPEAFRSSETAKE
jgi:hypothetical protein